MTGRLILKEDLEVTIYEVIPFKGVGPVLLGMSREEVRTAMGIPTKSYRKTGARTLTDAYHRGGFQVFFDEHDRVEYIELSSPDDSFTTVYKGKEVFQTKADDLVDLIAEDAPFDAEDPELGYTYTFSQLELGVWRPVIPEDDNDPEGRYFSTIGIGKRGYFSGRYH
jgi:hypothetical protein